MAVLDVRDVINYAHVREEKPAHWKDIGLSARTPVGAKAVLIVKRIDGQTNKWVFASGALYFLAEIGLSIRGPIHTPVPPV